MYRCLVCDVEIAPDTFPAHAAMHGWDLDRIRQCGFEWREPTATHEFAEPGGPALFWLMRMTKPLEVEHDY